MQEKKLNLEWIEKVEARHLYGSSERCSLCQSPHPCDTIRLALILRRAAVAVHDMDILAGYIDDDGPRGLIHKIGVDTMAAIWEGRIDAQAS